jgi:hypothetical protein
MLTLLSRLLLDRTSYTINESFQFLAPERNFSVLQNVQAGSGASLSSYSVGAWGSFPWTKYLRPEADLLPPSSAELNNTWSLPSLHHTPSWHAQGQLYSLILQQKCSYQVSCKENFVLISYFLVCSASIPFTSTC